jgi:glycosyltransferase involved in cell wall biosynthesis
MPRICHIITTLYETSGSTRRTLIEADYLLKKGWTVHLIIGKDASGAIIEECLKKGIEVFQIRCLCKYIHPLLEIRAFFQIAKILRQQKYDIVHTHLAKGGILGRLAAARAGVKAIIHTVHGPSFPKSKGWALRSLFILLEKLAGKFTHAMIFVGKEIGDVYMHSKIAAPHQSHTIYTGRDFKDYENALNMPEEEKRVIRGRYGISQNDIVIGCVGRIVPSKGHIFAIRVMHTLIQTYPEAKLIIIGKANLPDEHHYETKLRNIIKELGLDNNILFIDYQKDIAQYYAIMDVFILPSYYEGLPNAILEAVAMAIPVVAFDCGGVKEVFEICPGSGYRVPVGDMHEYYNTLEAVVKEMHSHRNNGRQFSRFLEIISKVWSIDQMLQKTDILYERLLGISSVPIPASISDEIKIHH